MTHEAEEQRYETPEALDVLAQEQFEMLDLLSHEDDACYMNGLAHKWGLDTAW